MLKIGYQGLSGLCLTRRRGDLGGSVTESVRDTHTWDGHLMLVHRDERQRRAGVVSWVRRGLELGAKILYTQPADEPSERALINVLKQHELDVDRAVDSGQLQVVPADDVTYSTTWQAGAIDAALAAGYPTVRWSAEAETAWGITSPTEHADIEWATDELCQRRPVSILCQYPSTLTRGDHASVCAMHGSRVRESLLHTFSIPGGIALAGEVDVSNAAILHSSLTAACRATELRPPLRRGRPEPPHLPRRGRDQGAPDRDGRPPGER